MAERRPHTEKTEKTEKAMSRVPMKTLYALLAASLVAALALGVVYVNASRDRGALQEVVRQLARKAAVLQKRYAEEKAAGEQQSAEQAALAGRQCEAEGQLAKLKAENAAALAAARAEAGKLKDEAAALRASVAQLTAAGTKAKAQQAELGDRLEKSAQDLKHAADEKNTLKEHLKAVNEKLAHCQQNNARLCALANELVAKYRDKGVVRAIMEREPLTQVEKVDLEKMTREYKSKIDHQRVQP